MSKRFWTILAIAGGVAVFALGAILVTRIRQGDDPAPNPEVAAEELFMPSEARHGQWGDPVEGARSEDLRRKIGNELSRLKDTGPIRCSLRAKPPAAAWNEPELEVELENVSNANVTIHIHQMLLDNVTFIFRAPDDSVVSTFCYVTVHSMFESKPPVVLRPREAQSSLIYLSVAGDHGFQSLRPGMYSLEAVFHDKLFHDLPIPELKMVARSNRVAIRVGNK
jgi:hypothetical protein